MLHQAVDWLNYTYMALRMKRNPLQYGLTLIDLEDDPQLVNRRYNLAGRRCLCDAKFKGFTWVLVHHGLRAATLGESWSRLPLKSWTLPG